MRDFPEIVTARLHLRSLRDEDARLYAEIRSDPTTYPFITGRPLSFGDSRAAIVRCASEFTAGTAIYWALTLKPDGEFVGYLAVHEPKGPSPAMSYAICASKRRQGLAREAMTAAIEYLFGIFGCTSLTVATHTENIASTRLLRSLGFSDTGERDTPAGRRLCFRKDRT
jgi:RimJ/RimL family protein N-acetyltransferase